MTARLGPSDLVLCPGTLPRASFRDRIAAAVAGGFAGIGLWLPHWERARAEGLTDEDMRGLLKDNGLVVTEIEAINDYGRALRGGRSAAREATPLERQAYDFAHAVQATTISLVDGPGRPLDVPSASEAFGCLCDRAADEGLDVAIEFWPGSTLDAAAAIDVVLHADRPNGGLQVDTWHLHHAPDAVSHLRAVSGDFVFVVQVADVQASEPSDYFEATMHARALPGEGVARLGDHLRLLDAIGARAPLGVEVLSDELHALPPVEIGRRAGEAMRRLFAESRRRAVPSAGC